SNEVTSATMLFLVPHTDDALRERRRLLEEATSDPAVAANVDSGRFAEAFWYVRSPLTTPDPTRPFEGRPPEGMDTDAGPGIVVPDLPVTVPDRPGVTRLRELLRNEFAVLLGSADDVATVQAIRRTLFHLGGVSRLAGA